jgi:hypothetical protein
VLLHVVFFAFWLIWNSLPGVRHFDNEGFPLLTMIVSLEAIFLSTFVLLSANRQAEKDRVRADIEYDVNLKAELEVAHLHVKLDRLRAEMLERLHESRPRTERAPGVARANSPEWERVRALSGRTLHTLTQGRPFRIVEVTDDRVRVVPGEGKGAARNLPRERIEHLLELSEHLDPDNLRAAAQQEWPRDQNTSYLAALVAALRADPAPG